MKRKGIFAGILFLMSLHVFGQKKDFDTDFLFFTTTAYPIRDVFFLDDQHCLVTKDIGANNEVFLYNNEMIATDTLKLRFAMCQVMGLSKQRYVGFSVNDVQYLSLEKDQIRWENPSIGESFLSAKYHRKAEGLIKDPYYDAIPVGVYDSMLIGYYTENHKPLKKLVHPPNFFVIDQGKLYPINTEKTGELPNFGDYYLYQYVKYWGIAGESFFFNVPQVNKCYFFNRKTKEVSVLAFPDYKDGIPYRYYYDSYSNREFVVSQGKIRQDIYEFIRKEQSYVRLLSLNTKKEVVKGFINGKVHTRREYKEKGKSYSAHYLLPLDNESQQYILLDEVETNE